MKSKCHASIRPTSFLSIKEKNGTASEGSEISKSALTSTVESKSYLLVENRHQSYNKAAEVALLWPDQAFVLRPLLQDNDHRSKHWVQLRQRPHHVSHHDGASTAHADVYLRASLPVSEDQDWDPGSVNFFNNRESRVTPYFLSDLVKRQVPCVL